MPPFAFRDHRASFDDAPSDIEHLKQVSGEWSEFLKERYFPPQNITLSV
jgi:hypothetical protein